jgi:hypothetical protein
MQSRSWGQAVPGHPTAKPLPMDRRPERKTNKYLNIIKGDITDLYNLLSNINGTINPYCWYRRWRNKKMEYKEFMEQHFGKAD